MDISEAFKLTKDERINYLKSCWGISEDNPIEVIGEVKLTSKESKLYHYRIINVKLIDNYNKIEYPIDNLINE